MLCPEGQLWVDVEAFEEAAETARRSRDPAAYRAAIELYAGELLPEDRYEEWAEEPPRRAEADCSFRCSSSSPALRGARERSRSRPSRRCRGSWRRSPPTRRRTWG